MPKSTLKYGGSFHFAPQTIETWNHHLNLKKACKWYPKVKLVVKTIGDPKRFNFSPTPFRDSPLNLVSKIFHILSDPQWENNLHLKTLSKLKPHHVSKILQIHNNTHLALHFFYWVSKWHFYKHDAASYQCLIGCAWLPFMHMDHKRILMIKACQSEDELKRVMSYLTEISGTGFGFYFV